MSQTRQLAAIMFTDMVGYTALMGRDEKKAFSLLQKSRDLQKPVIEEYRGRWIKELGDGVLASFTNGADAVQASIVIQNKCAAAGEFELRIGIHQGDVVFESGDVFGDAVNIASRIQAIAVPGGVYISEAVRFNLTSQYHITTRFVKTEILKNVKEPLNIYEVVLNGAESKSDPSGAKDRTQTIEKSIAVLPFVNMSNDPEQEYFGDGIAEELINSLVHIKSLKIAGRTSSAQFKGKQVDLKEIGRRLGVAHVLEGSIRKQGNRVRITAQLISVQDGFHLWSEKFDRDIQDIFAIQDEIALAITEQLRITLLDKERENLVNNATQNTEAYELVLKGRFYMNRRGSAIPVAVKYFEQAIAADPNYALAHSGYSWTNYLVAFYGYAPGTAVLRKMEESAEKAIKLDGELAEGFFALANYYAAFVWDWDKSQKAYLKAMQLNPKFAQAFSIYGMGYLCWIKGQFEEAENLSRAGIKADPLSAIDHADFAWTLYGCGKFEEGLAMARMGVELDGNSFLSHRLVGLCLIELNRAEEAIAVFEHLLSISQRHQHALCGLIWAHCRNGNLIQAQAVFEELLLSKKHGYVVPFYTGVSAAHLNRLDLAFEYLEQAFADRDPALIQIKYNAFVPASLKEDPRFSDLLKRIGFP